MSPICPEASRGRICTKFGKVVGGRRYNHVFFDDRLRGVNFEGGGRILPFPIDKPGRR